LKKDDKGSIKLPQLKEEVKNYFVEKFYKLGLVQTDPSKEILR